MSAASAGGEPSGEPPSSDKPDSYQNLDRVDHTTTVIETSHVPPPFRYPTPFAKHSNAKIERMDRKRRRARRLKQAESRRRFRFETYGSFVQLRYGKDAVMEYTRASFWEKRYDPVRRQYDESIEPSGSTRNLLDWMDDFSSDCELCPPAERRRVREPIPPPVPSYEWTYSSSCESDEKRDLDNADSNNETITGKGSDTETSYENTETTREIERKTRDWTQQQTDALKSAPETTQRPTIWRRKYVQLPIGNETAHQSTWWYTGGKTPMGILTFETMMDRVRMRDASIIAVHERVIREKNIKSHTTIVKADYECKCDACNDHGGESRSAGIEERHREVGEGVLVHGGGDVLQLEDCGSDEEPDDATNKRDENVAVTTGRQSGDKPLDP